MRMLLRDFEKIVKEVVTNLPQEFAEHMDNVAVVVEDWPSAQDLRTVRAHPATLLFGLYQGVPKTARGAYYSALPDKITIFAGPILSVSKDVVDAKRQIRSTVLHEIGHHFGMSEAQIRAAEKKTRI